MNRGELVANIHHSLNWFLSYRGSYSALKDELRYLNKELEAEGYKNLIPADINAFVEKMADWYDDGGRGNKCYLQPFTYGIFFELPIASLHGEKHWMAIEDEWYRQITGKNLDRSKL